MYNFYSILVWAAPYILFLLIGLLLIKYKDKFTNESFSDIHFYGMMFIIFIFIPIFHGTIGVKVNFKVAQEEISDFYYQPQEKELDFINERLRIENKKSFEPKQHFDNLAELSKALRINQKYCEDQMFKLGWNNDKILANCIKSESYGEFENFVRTLEQSNENQIVYFNKDDANPIFEIKTPMKLEHNQYDFIGSWKDGNYFWCKRENKISQHYDTCLKILKDDLGSEKYISDVLNFIKNR